MKVIIYDRLNSSEQMQHVLDEHGAKVLAPPAAPRTTIYRTGVLQVPDMVFGDGDESTSLLRAMNKALKTIGCVLVKPARRELPGFEAHEDHFRTYVHRRARLELRPGAHGPLDAGRALQVLQTSPDRRVQEIGELCELERVLHAARTPVLTAEDLHADPSTEGHPATVSFPWPGSGGRTPVTVVTAPPTRPALNTLSGRRRPVIAVLDTGVGAHPWLERAGSDPFVREDDDLQRLIDANDPPPGKGSEKRAPGTADRGSHLRAAGKPGPDAAHGTFITGLILQACPSAQVLGIRVMDDHGTVRENDLLLALAGVLARTVEAAAESDPSKFVDVVSLSAGYYLEKEADEDYTSQLLRLLEALSERGVLIVASAGNDATTRPCYPAAMPRGDGLVPLVLSVGALDPDGNRAPFSNYGDWVNSWAPGAAVISTVPTQDEPGREAPPAPEIGVEDIPPDDRRSADPSGFAGGFDMWSGTSFAAPLVAARLAGALIGVAGHDRALSLDEVKPETARLRAAAAFDSCRAK
jgi:hypothetical protein